MCVVGINATLNPRSMLVEGTCINVLQAKLQCWRVLGCFPVELGVFSAILKVGFLKESGISSGSTAPESKANCFSLMRTTIVVLRVAKNNELAGNFAFVV